MAKLPERFVGIWVLERSENFDEYLAAKGECFVRKDCKNFITRHELDSSQGSDDVVDYENLQ